MPSVKRFLALSSVALVSLLAAACGSLPSLGGQPPDSSSPAPVESSRAAPTEPPLASLGPPAAEAQGEGVELTVYNQDMALVKDRRTMALQEGTNEVRFTDVASQIDPTSVHFRSLTDPDGTTVLEQNYEYDIVGSQKLLEKYVDQEIVLNTQDGTSYQGTLLSGAQDVIPIGILKPLSSFLGPGLRRRRVRPGPHGPTR